MPDHPILDQWNSQSEYVQAQTREIAEKLAGRIEIFAKGTGRALTEWESWMLRHTFLDLVSGSEKYAETHDEAETQAYDDLRHEGYVTLVRNCIVLVREAITWEKENGIKSFKVRSGLTLPYDWQYGYDLIYNTGLPWTLSHILQSAFLGAPELGETRPWKSN